ncbi:MAG: hypothetical protein GXY85_04665 [Candidatus Brocadiaceae bacterium]|nr:hypothetical protein [Candidatus Brocadiaceae bacterium]
MKHPLVAAAVVALAAFAFVRPALAAGADPGPAGAQPTEQAPPSKAEVLAQKAETKVRSFATQVDDRLEAFTERRTTAWLMVAIGAFLGLLCMFFGWTLVKSLLIPFAPVLGLATGVVIAFCLIETLYAGETRPAWFRLTLLAVGAGLGVAAYLFSALRARPIAAFLVVMSPFLMLSAIFFTHKVFAQHQTLALVLFAVGFLMGFAAMVEVRPLAIISTALLGSCALLAVLGLLSHLLSDEVAFLHTFFGWLTENPDMLGLALLVMLLAAAGFQFATGPRGTLEG